MYIFRSDYEAKLAKITVEIVCERFTVPNLLLSSLQLSSLQSSSLSKVTLFSWVDTEKYNTKLVTVLRFFYIIIGVLHGHVYGIYHKYFLCSCNPIHVVLHDYAIKLDPSRAFFV